MPQPVVLYRSQAQDMGGGYTLHHAKHLSREVLGIGLLSAKQRRPVIRQHSISSIFKQWSVRDERARLPITTYAEQAVNFACDHSLIERTAEVHVHPGHLPADGGGG